MIFLIVLKATFFCLSSLQFISFTYGTPCACFGISIWQKFTITVSAFKRIDRFLAPENRRQGQTSRFYIYIYIFRHKLYGGAATRSCSMQMLLWPPQLIWRIPRVWCGDSTLFVGIKAGELGDVCVCVVVGHNY